MIAVRKSLPVVLVVGIVVVAPGSRAYASSWADSLFSEQSHDFGPLARGVKVRHPFVLNNRIGETITIVNLRASCGCTSGRASTSTVPAGQSAVIEAEMDTRNFAGHKATTLFVTLMTASGKEAEVKLGVSSNILADIVLNPGTIDFGVVARGEKVQRSLMIDRLGAPQWRCERMVSACKAIDAELVETKRPGATVSYTLNVALKPDTPAGPLRDEIRILTNDPETPSIPVLITGQIRGELTVAPSLLGLGRVTSAGGAQGKFVIRGTKPFTITAIDGEGDGFHVAPADNTAKSLHVLNVTYNPEESKARGDLRRSFRVQTNLQGEPPVELSVSLHAEP
jgi:uncharacterized protein DUF1573